MSFYNARWYDAKLGRFVSADTIVPNPGNPQSLNRYAYVLNNPLRYTDPSGHREVDCGLAEDCDGSGSYSAYQTPYLFSFRYGWIDRSHMIPTLAKQIIADVTKAVHSGGGSVILLPQRVGRFTILGRPLATYERRYEVSPLATEEQITGISLGMFMDAGSRWESWQGQVLFGKSEYSIEDLPSNYLGFVRAAKGWSEGEVLSLLGPLTPSTQSPHCAWDDCTFSFWPRLPTNREHTPLIYSNKQWTHGTWPDALQITPIDTSSGLWKFTGDASGGLLGPLYRRPND